MIPKEYWGGEGAFEGLGLNNLAANYQWPLNKNNLPQGVQIQGNDSLERTICLKNQLSYVWNNNANRRLELTIYIVQTWGGIHANNLNTLEQYAGMKGDMDGYPFAGISSRSKVLSIIDPQRFAIYDSRVSVALKAIQFLQRNNPLIWWPSPLSQNNIIQDFLNDPIFKFNGNMGMQRPTRNDTYQQYIEWLRIIGKAKEEEISKLEMCLFADAEELAQRAMQHVGVE